MAVPDQVRPMKKVEVLAPQRLVQTHAVADLGNRLRRRSPRHSLDRGVARDDEKERVRECGDDEDEHPQPQHAADDHPDHSFACPARGSRASRSASPTRLKAIVVDSSAKPGTAIIHTAVA